MEEKEEDDGRLTPTSSPPTPPSPLPVSVGPGNQKYDFSPSPTPSPPFSPHGSSQTSAENLPLLAEALAPAQKTPLALSVDCRKDDKADDDSQGQNCLKDLYELFPTLLDSYYISITSFPVSTSKMHRSSQQ
ncbi:hypothetical protein MLD38_005336 [Melastoma candidum]|uniref:Uncharacterized protein n=1 Tax=Melastoma candidum TaxID=119954 RepID=A0ACB9S885_9MYRT|nr:hypothetical protein MLD38_005336 [Melastoma candidum]